MKDLSLILASARKPTVSFTVINGLRFLLNKLSDAPCVFLGKGFFKPSLFPIMKTRSLF